MEYLVEDVGGLQDVLKLTFSFLDRTQGQIHKDERRRIEGFLRVFVPLIFIQDSGARSMQRSPFPVRWAGDGAESDSALKWKGKKGVVTACK